VLLALLVFAPLPAYASWIAVAAGRCRDEPTAWIEVSFRFAIGVGSWRTTSLDRHPGSWKEFLAARASRGDRRAIRRLRRQSRGLAIKSRENGLQALPSCNLRTSRGSIVQNLPGGIRLRESAGSIELLGEARDEALEQLVKTAKQRFGACRVTLVGRKDVQQRLTRIAADRGLEITQERER